MKKQTCVLIITYGIIFSGCELINFEKERDLAGSSFLMNNTEYIQKYLVDESFLSEEEVKYIREVSPRTSYYMMTGSYGQFKWSWDLPSKHRLWVDYTGDIVTIDPNFITHGKDK